MKDLLLIALILVCPLAMVWMMSRGHGHGGNSGPHNGRADTEELGPGELPTEALRRERDELDRLIAAREQAEAPPKPGEG